MGEAPSFLERLKQRKLVHWALAYLAGAWLVLQVLDLLAQPFAWPALVLRAATVLLAIGFFAALVLAWYHGERGNQRVTGVELLMLAGILVVAAVSVMFVSGAVQRPHSSDAAFGPAEARSLAVLPLVDLSPGHDQGYFADGVTSELIDLVGQINGLRVPGPTSSFYFKGKNLPLREVARQLGVAHVLEGGAFKDGRHIRVTIRLTDAARDRQLWSHTYETESGDPAEIQHQIASHVASNIAQTASALPSRPPTNPEVYDLYLQGLFALKNAARSSGDNSGNSGDNWEQTKAIGLFGDALRLDSAFAPAWAGTASAHYRAGDFAQAKAAARRALALDSTLPLARGALAGSLAYSDWKWREAERILDDGIRLAPSSAFLYLARANLRFVLGRERDAFADHDRAAVLEPLSLEVVRNRISLLDWTDHWADMVQALERLPSDDPWRASRGIIENYMVGNRDTALALARKYRATDQITLMRGNRDSLAAVVRRREAAGNPCAAASALRRYWLYHQGRRSAEELHEVQASFADHLYPCLEGMVNARFRFVAFQLRDSKCDSLRAQPRFQALMRRVGLPD